MGFTYLVSLLYFVSHGEGPIYDRFAMQALLAITGERAEGKNLPEKNADFPIDAAQIMYKCINLLKRVFDGEYKIDRRINRAMWVYGHCIDALPFINSLKATPRN